MASPGLQGILAASHENLADINTATVLWLVGDYPAYYRANRRGATGS